MTTAATELRANDLRLALRPDLGAAVTGFWHGQLPVLVSADDASSPSTAAAAGGFALAPYGHRLGLRRFRWQGRDFTTLPNSGDNSHSLHGVAWRRAWELREAGVDHLRLEYRHAADGDWPFDFAIVQTLQLDPDGLRIALALTNTGGVTQPAALGWQAWFPRRQRSRLHAELTDRWENDPGTRLPTRRVAQAGLDGDVAHMDFDHCFGGWRGPARIRDERLSVKLSASLPYLVISTPAASDRFGVAPLGHVSNAFHMADPLAHGLVALAPGQTIEAWVRLEVARV